MSLFDPRIFDPRIFDTGAPSSVGVTVERHQFTLTVQREVVVSCAVQRRFAVNLTVERALDVALSR